MTQPLRTLPSINVGTPENLENINYLQNRTIIQEKVDGSQLTIHKENSELHYYNKNKRIDGKGKPFLNAYLSLCNHPEFFQEGLWYHGEAFLTRLTNTCEYERTPRYFWIVYEIVRSDNTILTPEEMHDLLLGTGIETVSLFWDSISQTKQIALTSVVTNLMFEIENGIVKSCLGLAPEGFIVKVLNRIDHDKVTNGRFKFVRPLFTEMNHQKKARLSEIPDETFIKELGDVYNMPARYQKAIQHLKEREKWHENPEKNISALVDELDQDLLKEQTDDIKNLLFIRFWPRISQSARRDLTDFVKKLPKQD